MPRPGKNRAYAATWITPADMRKLKREARRRKVSVASLLRDLIIGYLERD